MNIVMRWDALITSSDLITEQHVWESREGTEGQSRKQSTWLVMLFLRKDSWCTQNTRLISPTCDSQEPSSLMKLKTPECLFKVSLFALSHNQRVCVCVCVQTTTTACHSAWHDNKLHILYLCSLVACIHYLLHVMHHVGLIRLHCTGDTKAGLNFDNMILLIKKAQINSATLSLWKTKTHIMSLISKERMDTSHAWSLCCCYQCASKINSWISNTLQVDRLQKPSGGLENPDAVRAGMFSRCDSSPSTQQTGKQSQTVSASHSDHTDVTLAC